MSDSKRLDKKARKQAHNERKARQNARGRQYQ